ISQTHAMSGFPWAHSGNGRASSSQNGIVKGASTSPLTKTSKQHTKKLVQMPGTPRYRSSELETMQQPSYINMEFKTAAASDPVDWSRSTPESIGSVDSLQLDVASLPWLTDINVFGTLQPTIGMPDISNFDYSDYMKFGASRVYDQNAGHLSSLDNTFAAPLNTDGNDTVESRAVQQNTAALHHRKTDDKNNTNGQVVAVHKNNIVAGELVIDRENDDLDLLPDFSNLKPGLSNESIPVIDRNNAILDYDSDLGDKKSTIRKTKPGSRIYIDSNNYGNYASGIVYDNTTSWQDPNRELQFNPVGSIAGAVPSTRTMVGDHGLSNYLNQTGRTGNQFLFTSRVPQDMFSAGQGKLVGYHGPELTQKNENNASLTTLGVSLGRKTNQNSDITVGTIFTAYNSTSDSVIDRESVHSKIRRANRLMREEKKTRNNASRERQTLFHPTDDPSIPNSQNQHDTHVSGLVSAMRNNKGCLESNTTEEFITRWQDDATYYTYAELHTAADELVTEMTKIHKEGWKKPIYDSGRRELYRKTIYFTFNDRYEAVREYLKCSKTICADIMKGERFWSLLGNPTELMKRAMTNQRSNKTKGIRLSFAIAAEKAKKTGDAKKNGESGKQSKRAREDENNSKGEGAASSKKARAA
ncbi:hypothetical protein IAQ61_010801, partial [Plenodomus lingam]